MLEHDWRKGEIANIDFIKRIKDKNTKQDIEVNRHLDGAVILEINESHFVFLDTVRNKRVEVHRDDVRNIEYVNAQGGGVL